MITLTRPGARIAEQGRFPVPGIPGASYVVGADAIRDAMTWELTAGPLAVDIETAGMGAKRYDVKAVTISDDDTALICDPRDPVQFQIIRDLLNSGRSLGFHNSPFDVPPLYCVGLLELDSIEQITDTLIYARGANPDERTSKRLLDAVNRHLGMGLVDHLPEVLKTLGWSKAEWFERGDLTIPAYRLGCASDGITTSRLAPAVRQAFYDRITTGHPFTVVGVTGQEAWDLVEREQILNRPKLRRSCVGFRVDLDYLATYREQTDVQAADDEQYLRALGIRPGNPGDLTRVLEERGLLYEGYPKTKGGAWSTTAANLETLNDETALRFTGLKKITKVRDDYLTKVVENAGWDGRIRPGVGLLAATTGRESINGDAPLHQYPAAARGIILADPGDSLTSIDWQQIEVVMAANLARDTAFLDTYENGSADVHQLISIMAGIPRKVAKAVVFGTLYGEGITKLAYQLGVTVADAKAIQAKVWEVLPGVQGMFGKVGYQLGKVPQIARDHRLIMTLSGRIIPIGAGWRDCWNKRENACGPHCRKCGGKGSVWSVHTHKGTNYTIQGGAYDLLADAQLRVHQAGLSDAVYLAMHDELITSTSAAHDIQKIMETPPERLVYMAKRTPILRTDRVDMGERWTDA